MTSYSSNYCFVSVSVGRNKTAGLITSQELDGSTFGKWTSVTGSYKPKRAHDLLYITAACDSEDNSVTGEVLIDAVALTPNGRCCSD